MKAIDDIRTISATYLHDYVIRFEFSDGKVHDLDFYPFLSRKPQNPMTSKYLDLELFRKFEMDGDDIQWNKHEMCYSFFTLYYGFDQDMKQEARYYKNAPTAFLQHFPQKQRRKKELA